MTENNKKKIDVVGQPKPNFNEYLMNKLDAECVDLLNNEETIYQLRND